MVGWHHRLNRHEFEQTPGDREGQGSLVCSSPWGHKELQRDLATEQQRRLFLIQVVCRFRTQIELVGLECKTAVPCPLFPSPYFQCLIQVFLYFLYFFHISTLLDLTVFTCYSPSFPIFGYDP